MSYKPLLALALAANLALCGCDAGSRYVTQQEASDIADDYAEIRTANLRARIIDLETKNTELERRLAALERDARSLSGFVDQNAQVINQNARAFRETQRRERTRRGECGTELVTIAPGIVQNRQIECR